MGDKVWIKVVAANLIKRQLDYEWIVAGEIRKTQEEPREEKRKKRRKQ
jgi:ribonuclease R